MSFKVLKLGNIRVLRSFMWLMVVVAALTFGTGQAYADLSLNGDPLTGSLWSYASRPGYQMNVLDLQLSDINRPPFDISISTGGHVFVTVNLTSPYTVNASPVVASIVQLSLSSSYYPNTVDTGTNAISTFYNKGNQVYTGQAEWYTKDRLVAGTPWGLGSDAITFDQVTWDITGIQSGDPKADFTLYGLDTADLSFFQEIPVGAPVPIPAAVWLLGSGLVGLAGLRRKFSN